MITRVILKFRCFYIVKTRKFTKMFINNWKWNWCCSYDQRYLKWSVSEIFENIIKKLTELVKKYFFQTFFSSFYNFPRFPRNIFVQKNETIRSLSLKCYKEIVCYFFQQNTSSPIRVFRMLQFIKYLDFYHSYVLELLPSNFFTFINLQPQLSHSFNFLLLQSGKSQVCCILQLKMLQCRFLAWSLRLLFSCIFSTFDLPNNYRKVFAAMESKSWEKVWFAARHFRCFVLSETTNIGESSNTAPRYGL